MPVLFYVPGLKADAQPGRISLNAWQNNYDLQNDANQVIDIVYLNIAEFAAWQKWSCFYSQLSAKSVSAVLPMLLGFIGGTVSLFFPAYFQAFCAGLA
ncbi:hypothetical protein [Pseudogemmobacter faecipullorum]|uniref:Uncharacterized protein n=1 Tax=Pseudogemmobacter faecipullorum TaxID=2755041 RepID=A0ABS8CN85_9RHOB|nr:hypothetical protein [Pseudogemmobacter faecipullorum]MCB5410300.1 hypothetical protein [Pseudogemmobacter faecipullorum]